MAVTRKRTNISKGKKRTKKNTGKRTKKRVIKGGDNKKKRWLQWGKKSKINKPNGITASTAPIWAENKKPVSQYVNVRQRRHIGRKLPSIPANNNNSNNITYDSSAGKITIPIIKEDPKKIKDLGQGEYGKTVLGSVSKCAINKGKTEVVYKKMKSKTGSEKNRNTANKIFEHEAKMHWLISGLNSHNNVVKIFGVGKCEGSKLECIMMEVCSMGALEDLLRKKKYGNTYNSDDIFLIRMAREIAKGLKYVHGQNVVHLDLAVRNVFLTDKLVSKIGDFGLAQILHKDRARNILYEGGKWPVRYYNPSMILGGKYGRRTDFWSYGILLWELYNNGSLPYHTLTNKEVIDKIQLKNNNRYLAQDGCPNEIYEIMKKLWSNTPPINSMDLIESVKGTPQKRSIEAITVYPDGYKNNANQLNREFNGQINFAERERERAREAKETTNNDPFGKPPPPPPRRTNNNPKSGNQIDKPKPNPFNNGNN